jgi:uncharacterized protein YecE (DUF72 family)
VTGSLTIGTAGWSIPAKDAGAFPTEGTALQRYAGRFSGVEINSSFHRPHRASTWARWGASVPDDFRFAVKVPKTITHQHKLEGCEELLATFLDEASGLGPKLGVWLVQLPPKLAFDAVLVMQFFRLLSNGSGIPVACEPRHPSWFEAEADAMLHDIGVARAAADPAVTAAAGLPGGHRGLSYWRLHGSPVMYRSPYGLERIAAYAALLGEEVNAGRQVWCMFDNTASSAATGDALLLADALRPA